MVFILLIFQHNYQAYNKIIFQCHQSIYIYYMKAAKIVLRIYKKREIKMSMGMRTQQHLKKMSFDTFGTLIRILFIIKSVDYIKILKFYRLKNLNNFLIPNFLKKINNI